VAQALDQQLAQHAADAQRTLETLQRRDAASAAMKAVRPHHEQGPHLHYFECDGLID
jgi:hypothetical protein